MNIRLAVIILVTYALAGTRTHTIAQGKSWVGEYVLNTKQAKDIQLRDRMNGKQVLPFSGRWPFKVLEDREGWLRIHDGHREGWVAKAAFVPVNDAPAYFQRQVEVNPKDSWALLMRGAGWLWAGMPDKAIKDFDECIRLDPTDSSAFTCRGIAWDAKREYDKAIKDYDEAIRIDPNDPIAYYNRSLTWTHKKENEKAIKDCDDSIRLDPKNVWPYYHKACCYALLSQTDRAIESLRQSLELGFHDFQHLLKDSDLDSLRDDSRYKQLIEKYGK